MGKIKVNPDNLIKNFDIVWEKSAKTNGLISEMWQDILKHGYGKPLTPEFVNALLEKYINPAKENCRNMTQIALECRKNVKDMKQKTEDLAN